ncbi:unnamed protein product [Protopolystoma xenopodis]|uniref:Uncharacterized protein n=1 Tax=Protopolystoma xenopodis TaxID=117903 RepID=A0A448XLP9_9PLAT|nr:unnamed protein product [Protopolystoma xenopodis]
MRSLGERRPLRQRRNTNDPASRRHHGSTSQLQSSQSEAKGLTRRPGSPVNLATMLLFASSPRRISRPVASTPLG